MISLFLSIIGAVFAYQGWKGFRQRSRQIAGSVSAVGSVIDLVPININGRRLYSPKVAFTTGQGCGIIFVSDYGTSWKTFLPNQQIEIFYDPRNPQMAVIKADPSSTLLYPALMIIGGTVAIGRIFFSFIEVFIYYLILSAK